MEDTTQGPRETQGGAADDGGTGGRGALNGEEPAGRGWGKVATPLSHLRGDVKEGEVAYEQGGAEPGL